MTNQSFIRNMNERRILTLLRREGSLSRAEIARRLSLTRSAVTYLAEELMAGNLVAEAAITATDQPARDAGRPGVALSLKASGNYFLGAEIGVNVMRFALVDMTIEPAKTKTTNLAKPPTPAQAIRSIGSFLDQCEADHRYRGRVRAVGVTVPGLVRSDGLVVHLPILGWRDVNFLGLARRSIRIPVSIENNTNAAAFGEVYRHPKLSDDLILFLKLGNGFGGAAIINGRLLRGTGGVATEFGHMRVGADGPRCHCGQVGCLETHVNLTALARYLAEEGAAVAPDPELVAQAVRHGHTPTIAAVRKLETHLASGMVSLVNIFNPSDIVLGGMMRPVLELGLDRLRQAVAAGIVPGMTLPAIALSRGNLFECAVGAAAIAHHQQFDATAIALEGPAGTASRLSGTA
jgi:N-acetylglucosamine repressor